MGEQALSLALVRSAVHYNQESGEFVRLTNARGHKAGTLCASPFKGGYLRVSIAGHRVLCHRLAFFWMTGSWPSGVVDHINGNTSDNRWANLRDVTHSVNCQNQRRAKCKTASGLLGVYMLKGRPRAGIFHNGRQIHLGTFDTPEQAHDAYLAAKRRLHEGCTI